MLDDSWDDYSPSTSPKPISSKSAGRKFGSMDDSTDALDDKNYVPSKLSSRPSRGQSRKSSDDNFNADVLFSPANSQGDSPQNSPSPSAKGENLKTFSLDEPPPQKSHADYLANFVTNSGDLEDSILGELLGTGGGSKKHGAAKPHKLLPLDGGSSPAKPEISGPGSGASSTQTYSPTGGTSRRNHSPGKSFKSSSASFRGLGGSTDAAADLSDPSGGGDALPRSTTPVVGLRKNNSFFDPTSSAGPGASSSLEQLPGLTSRSSRRGLSSTPVDFDVLTSGGGGSGGEGRGGLPTKTRAPHPSFDAAEGEGIGGGFNDGDDDRNDGGGVNSSGGGGNGVGYGDVEEFSLLDSPSPVKAPTSVDTSGAGRNRTSTSSVSKGPRFVAGKHGFEDDDDDVSSDEDAASSRDPSPSARNSGGDSKGFGLSGYKPGQRSATSLPSAVPPTSSSTAGRKPLSLEDDSTDDEAILAAGKQAASAGNGKEDEDSDDDANLGGFIPSFMEPGRQNRRRRQLDSPKSPSGGSGPPSASGGPLTLGPGVVPGGGRGKGKGGLDELDMALGLSGPATAPKAVVDPFSKLESKLSTKASSAAAFMRDSNEDRESSSDDSDDIFRRRSRFNRPADKVIKVNQVPQQGGGGDKKATTTTPSGASAASAVDTVTAVSASTKATSKDKDQDKGIMGKSESEASVPAGSKPARLISPTEKGSGYSRAKSPTKSSKGDREKSPTSKTGKSPAGGVKITSFAEPQESPLKLCNSMGSSSMASLPSITPGTSFRAPNMGSASGDYQYPNRHRDKSDSHDPGAVGTVGPGIDIKKGPKAGSKDESGGGGGRVGSDKEDGDDDEEVIDVSGIVRIDVDDDLAALRTPSKDQPGSALSRARSGGGGASGAGGAGAYTPRGRERSSGTPSSATVATSSQTKKDRSISPAAASGTEGARPGSSGTGASRPSSADSAGAGGGDDDGRVRGDGDGGFESRIGRRGAAAAAASPSSSSFTGAGGRSSGKGPISMLSASQSRFAAPSPIAEVTARGASISNSNSQSGVNFGFAGVDAGTDVDAGGYVTHGTHGVNFPDTYAHATEGHNVRRSGGGGHHHDGGGGGDDDSVEDIEVLDDPPASTSHAGAAGKARQQEQLHDPSHSQKQQQMQRLVQHAQQDKVAHQRKLQLELESLKVKLAQETAHHPDWDRDGDAGAGAGGRSFGSSYEDREQLRVVHESNVRHLQELIDHKRIIAQLESEISRLRDEANIKAARHSDEVRQLRDKHEEELSDVRSRNSMDIEALERRHKESLQAARKLHEQEVEALKERFRSEDKFEQIVGQLRSTSGAIRFIEEQLSTKQKGAEALREGHLAAREQLLEDLESKARERAELAEAEGYRLKGILSHMEQVVSNLRSQGAEEKERLKQENDRLLARQTALEAEKTSLQQRNADELAYIKQRGKEVELELLKFTQERQAHFDALAEQQRKLDGERNEYATHLASSRSALEARERRLKDEEGRIRRLREECQAERNALEDRLAAAMSDIEGAEQLKAALVEAREANEREKEELRAVSAAYQNAAAELEGQQEALAAQQTALEERELALREGFSQMKLAASELSQRERALEDAAKVLELKRQAAERTDRDLVQKRLIHAASFREWAMQPPPQAQSSQALVLATPQHIDSYGGDATVGAPRSSSSPTMTQQHHHHHHQQQSSSIAAVGIQSVDELFTKYDFYGDGQAAHDSFNNTFPPSRAGNGDMSRNVAGDATAGSLNQSLPASQPPPPPREPAQQQQQGDQVQWIDTFRQSMQRAFQNGGSGGGGGGGGGSVGARVEAGFRGGGAGAGSAGWLPAEVRVAQGSLRQSRTQLQSASASALSMKKLLQDESDFISSLQQNRDRKVPGPRV